MAQYLPRGSDPAQVGGGASDPDGADTIHPVAGAGSSRRTLVIALLGLVQLGGCHRGDEAVDGWMPVVPLQDLQDRDVLYVADHGVFIVDLGHHLLALSDDAQHIEGERVLYCEASRTFMGPHGEFFDGQGRYVAGPARTDLDLYPVRAEAGWIQVDLDRVVEGVDRSHVGVALAAAEECQVETAPGMAGPPGP